MFFWFIKIIAFLPFWLLYPTIIKKKTKSKLPKGKCVFVCNHISNIDALIVLNGFCRTQYTLTKKEAFKNPFLRFFLKSMKAIQVDRDNVDITAIKQSLTVLKKNKTLLIFPEGTRNKKKEELLLEIKNGAGIFAIKSKAPIVPLWIKKTPKPFCLNTIYVGEPFYLTKEDMENGGEIVRQHMLDLAQKSLKK